MYKFFKRYVDQILMGVAIALIAIVAWFFTLTTALITSNFSKAIAPAVPESGSLRFKTEEAKTLDYKGFGS